MHKTNCCGEDLCYDFSQIRNGDRVRCMDGRKGIVEIRDQCDGSGKEFQILVVHFDDNSRDYFYPHQLVCISQSAIVA